MARSDVDGEARPARGASTPSAHRSSRRRILRQSAIVAIASVLSLAVLALASFALAREYEAVLAELSEAASLHHQLQRVRELAVESDAAHIHFVLTAEAGSLAALGEARSEMDETLSSLDRALPAAADAALVRPLRAAIARRFELEDATLAMAERGEVAGARARIASEEGRQRLDDVRARVDDLRAARRAHVDALRARASDARARLVVVFAAIVVLALAIGGFGAVVVRRELHLIDETARALERSERDARESEERFRSVAEASSDLVQIRDRTGRTLYASPSSERLLGYTPAELIEREPGSTVHPEDRAGVVRAVREALASGAPPEPVVHRVIRRDGEIRWFETRIEPVHGPSGAVERFHTIARDVSDRVADDARRTRDSERFAQLAHRDELTGLLNRRGFQEEAEAVLARARAQGLPALLAFCDVDGLKVINDQLGHEMGDEVIRDAAELLITTARGSDVVARVGGDEFVVLGTVRDVEAARAFEERLRARVRAHNASTERPYRVSISVGASVWQPDGSKTLHMLTKEADAAMYEQKRVRRSAATASGRDIVRPKLNN